jgi:hypothetical protein
VVVAVCKTCQRPDALEENIVVVSEEEEEKKNAPEI